jgi:ABC-type transporter Mla subunit MlaD
VKLPSVPGPGDLLDAVGGVRDGFAEALALVPRVASAVGSMEQLLGRVSALLDRVDGVVDRADAAIDRLETTRAKADEAIDAVGGTASRADGIVARAEDMVGRIEPLIGDFEPSLTALAPAVRRLAATLDPSEVEAMVTLVDRLPRLVTHLDEDILPVLESLGNVGTDVHDLVDTVQDLRQVVKGFPGSRLFRRRGAEEIAQEDAREAVPD